MMKKRILASSMASVMALSSVSVVAFADTKASETITKADLEKFIEEKEEFIAEKLPEYGESQDEQYQAAVDHCRALLEDSKATDADCTAAYQMVLAVESKLQKYTVAQLKALVKEWQSVYDSNNIRNEDLEDLIYSESTFDDFVEAFENAEDYVDSDDTRETTNAYVLLEEATENLKKLNTVTKAQFRAAIKAYEQLELEMKDYESWRRGSFSYVPTTGGYADKTKLKANFGKVVLSFKQVIDMVYGESNDSTLFYWKNATIKTDGLTLKSGKTWIGDNDKLDVGKTYNSMKEAITDQYERLNEIKSANETSNEAMVAAYKAAQDAVKLFNSWTADTTYKSGSATKAENLLKKYNGHLVAAFAATDVADVSAAIAGFGSGYDVTDYALEAPTMTCKKDVYVLIDEATGVAADPSDVDSCFAAAEAGLTASSGQKVVRIVKGKDILQYIPYTAKNGVSGEIMSGSYDNLAEYINDIYTAFADEDLSTTGGKDNAVKLITTTYPMADAKEITSTTVKTEGWTLVYRCLGYVLEDAFPAKSASSSTTYTLAKLRKLMDKAYDSVEAAGDAAIFAPWIEDVVEVRQNANEWYKQAIKAKKFVADESKFEFDGTDTMIADVYDALEDVIDDLDEIVAMYSISYGEIRELIVTVSTALEKGEVKGDDLKKALTQCAYDLSTIDEYTTVSGVVTDDNKAFDDERNFQAINRLKSDNNKDNEDDENKLLASYKALQAAYEAAKTPVVETVKFDADGDGKIGVADLQAGLAAYTGTYNAVFDADGNGKIDVSDLQAMLAAYTAKA